jgi:hypothetical protein
MRRIDDTPHIGERFGKWVVAGIGRRTAKRSYLVCVCACGAKKEILRENLFAGVSTGCRKCSGRVGANNPAWRGYGTIPQHYYGIMCRSAAVRGLSVSVSIEDIHALWNANGGKCALSGVPIEIGNRKDGCITASIDRIEPSKGYEAGNLQFVHKDVNLMKNKFSETYFVAMCKKIAECAAG